MRITSFLSAALLSISLPIMAMAQASNTSSPSYKAGIDVTQESYLGAQKYSRSPLRLVQQNAIKQGATDAFNGRAALASDNQFKTIIDATCPITELHLTCDVEKIGNKLKISMHKLLYGSPFSKEELYKLNYAIGYSRMYDLKKHSHEANLKDFNEGVDAWTPQN